MTTTQALPLPLGSRVPRDERCTYGACESHRYFESREYCYWHSKVAAGLTTPSVRGTTAGHQGGGYINPNVEARPAGEHTRARANQRWVRESGG